MNMKIDSKLSRRTTIQHGAVVAGLLAAAGLFPGLALASSARAFEAKRFADALKALGLAVPVQSRDVTLSGPDIAENGASVQVSAGTTLPGVKQLLLLVEKNPHALVAIFHLTDAVDANFTMRTKMEQSSDVYAVAVMQDGRVLFARREIRVTLGGCGA